MNVIREYNFLKQKENEAKISFDGRIFKPAGSSKYQHGATNGLPFYKGNALTTGCHSKSETDCGDKTELMDLSTLKWSDGPDFPFSEL